MVQSRIGALIVSRTAALTERAQRIERLHELVAQRRRIAEALSLEWPQARHHGKASGQMLCMSLSALTNLCLLVPHCRSLHGGYLAALCFQNLEHWPTM